MIVLVLQSYLSCVSQVSQVILSVIEPPGPFVYPKLPVYELLALSMAEALMVALIRLDGLLLHFECQLLALTIGSSYTLSSPVSGVTIKTVLKLSICIPPAWVLLQRHSLWHNSLNCCEGTGAHKELPASPAPTHHYGFELLFHN